MPSPGALPPLIAHVIHRFDVGGMENGLVTLINHMPEGRYRHAVVCLQDFTEFRRRIERPDVSFLALNRRPGKDFRLYPRLWRALRRLRPDLVHTRNLSALEGQVVAALAGVPARVHGEHGRDVFDLYGRNWKYNLLRRGVRPFVTRYTTVSKDLERWLIETVGVDPARVTQIYNGVDTERFMPRPLRRRIIGPSGFAGNGEIVIGSVGRMAEVKDYPALVRAFLRLLDAEPAWRDRIRLVILGDGPAREPCLRLLEEAGAASRAWLPGERRDVSVLMQSFDVFVLPSLGEGISNTILEAMACGLPVVATRVGGNPELVEERVTGTLVPSENPEALADALAAYIRDPERRREEGARARRRTEQRFSINAMVAGYLSAYDAALSGARATVTGGPAGPTRGAAAGRGE
jgi:sugar transferase (PEP-CTERM/EpsH1 system associated)